DLGMALGRLFLPGSPLCERFASSRCFVRYAVIEDNIQRRAAHTAFKQWMSSSAEAAWGGIDDIAMPPALLREASQAAENKDRNSPSESDTPPLSPSCFKEPQKESGNKRKAADTRRPQKKKEMSKVTKKGAATNVEKAAVATQTTTRRKVSGLTFRRLFTK